METFNSVLGIAASIFSIIAVIISWRNHKEIQGLIHVNLKTKQHADGTNIVQQNGAINQGQVNDNGGKSN
ncbi:hypothetical protein FD09_GL000510 [Schleiferilactobacillus perolens DSM 12744]|uniref:Uncharacterized protein n=2 Tax=Schleiferilactobacillus perolens TaxID=100468 RepID=A0A0R1MUJ0_9LACO|nr:hypothetical protein FD09_GL000510 [Schleiferilactobacillus perolens DSM 12744]